MLCAQSVPPSTDTSAETTTPLTDSSVHDRLDKAFASFSFSSSFTFTFFFPRPYPPSLPFPVIPLILLLLFFFFLLLILLIIIIVLVGFVVLSKRCGAYHSPSAMAPQIQRQTTALMDDATTTNRCNRILNRI